MDQQEYLSMTPMERNRHDAEQQANLMRNYASQTGCAGMAASLNPNCLGNANNCSRTEMQKRLAAAKEYVKQMVLRKP